MEARHLISILTLNRAINYMVSQSDNNACNWLIYFVGGIQNVNAFIKDLGIDQIQLIETEKSMEQDIRKSYNNWSTPLSVRTAAGTPGRQCKC